eukprot:2372875-Amphidinium_carterae.1
MELAIKASKEAAKFEAAESSTARSSNEPAAAESSTGARQLSEAISQLLSQPEKNQAQEPEAAMRQLLQRASSRPSTRLPPKASTQGQELLQQHPRCKL